MLRKLASPPGRSEAKVGPARSISTSPAFTPGKPTSSQIEILKSEITPKTGCPGSTMNGFDPEADTFIVVGPARLNRYWSENGSAEKWGAPRNQLFGFSPRVMSVAAEDGAHIPNSVPSDTAAEKTI